MLKQGLLVAGLIAIAGAMPGSAWAASASCSGAALTEEAMTACLTGVGNSISNTSRGIRPATPGAAAPAPAPAAAPAAVDLEINFAFGSADLSGDARAVLDRLARVLNGPALGGKNFNVIGHTDGVGGDQENLALSVTRAQAVGSYLSQQGVSAGRLATSGVGKRDFKNPQDPGAAENRRVEILPAG